jgi:hypothetical protein
MVHLLPERCHVPEAVVDLPLTGWLGAELCGGEADPLEVVEGYFFTHVPQRSELKS